MHLRISLMTAAVCTLLYLVLSARVIAARKNSNYSIHVSPDAELQERIRAHGNFGEYAPLALLFMTLLELAGAHEILLAVSGALLVVSRISHAYGMQRPAPNVFRLFGVIGTFCVLSVECAAGAYFAFI